MLSTLTYLPRLVGQMYRSGQAFAALHALRKGARQGFALDNNPALGKLANAMRVSPQVARDVYMGNLRTDTIADFIVGAHKTLLGARLLSRLSPATGTQVSLMLGEVRAAHVKSLQEAVSLTRGLVAQNKQEGQQIKQLVAKRLPQAAKQARLAREFSASQLSELTDEMSLLTRGLSGKLVDL